jgi:hypothetical protein
VGAQQRGDVPACRCQQLHHIVVLGLIQAEPAVFGRYLHSERAQLPKSFDDAFRILTGGVVRDGIDLAQEKLFHLGIKLHEFRTFFYFRIRMDQVEPVVSQEQLLEKTGGPDIDLPGGFGDFHGLFFTEVVKRVFTHVQGSSFFESSYVLSSQ